MARLSREAHDAGDPERVAAGARRHTLTLVQSSPVAREAFPPWKIGELSGREVKPGQAIRHMQQEVAYCRVAGDEAG